MFFKTYWILWINARSLKYIKAFNGKVARDLADSKLKTKEFLKKQWVNVPQTLKILKKHEELTKEMIATLEPPFVIKPNNGFWGKGILVVDSVDHNGIFKTNTGDTFSAKRLLIHLSNVLDGFFSLSGSRDKAMIEKKIVIDSDIALLWKYWLPDLRIILFNRVPVMAMIRIPTEKSWGKANLHAGACAAGIDIWNGRLTYTVQNSKQIKSIPGIGNVRGTKLPDWEKILELAVKVQYVTNIQYLGCDIVLDENEGPLLLEMNIRPWLEVQVVNNAPLHTRLKKVEWIEVNSVEKWVRLWRDLFSGDLEERVKNITWKNILGMREYVQLERKEKSYKYIADIRASQESNYIDEQFVRETLQFLSVEEWVRFKVTLLEQTKNMRFLIKKDLWVKMTIGSKSLRGFLVDPYKYKKWELPTDKQSLNNLKVVNSSIIKNYKDELQKIDKAIFAIDKKLLILKHLIPTNINEQRQLFIESEWTHIPEFEYDLPTHDFEAMRSDLEKIEVPDIPLGALYVDKKEEVRNKLAFLEAFCEGDSKEVALFSKKIYGDIIPENYEEALTTIQKKWNIDKEKEMALSEIRSFLKKFNHIYGIHLRLVEKTTWSRFAMKGNKLMMRKWAKVSKKELRSIIAHEVEGHYLRKLNGQKQFLEIFSKGSAWYIETDEGIAIYNQSRFLNEKDAKYYGIYERYYFINYALNHSYKRFLKKMEEYYANDYSKIFAYTLRLKRGMRSFSDEGIFYKDVVYLNGYMDLQNFLDQGWDLKKLYMWKIKTGDLDVVTESKLIDINVEELKVPFFS
jgi:alpha-L-glutamate ligase-like protein